MLFGSTSRAVICSNEETEKLPSVPLKWCLLVARGTDNYMALLIHDK